MPVTDAQFDRQYNDTKSFLTALETYEKCSRKAMLAMQQVSGSLADLSASMKNLLACPDVTDSVKLILDSADAEVRAFQLSRSYLTLNQQLHSNVMNRKTMLSKSAKRLRDIGHERKAAKEAAEKYVKKQNEPKYYTQYREAKQVFEAKEFNFSSEYTNLCRLREQTVPEMLAMTLGASSSFVEDFGGALEKAKAHSTAAMAGAASARTAAPQASAPPADAERPRAVLSRTESMPSTASTPTARPPYVPAPAPPPAAHSTVNRPAANPQTIPQTNPTPYYPATGGSYADVSDAYTGTNSNGYVALPPANYPPALYGNSTPLQRNGPVPTDFEQAPPLYSYPPRAVDATTNSVPGTRMQGIPLVDKTV